MFSLSSLLVAVPLLFSCSVAAPTTAIEVLPRAAKHAAASQDAPRFVAYSDKWVSGETGPPSVDTIKVRIFFEYITFTILTSSPQGFNVL